MFGAATPGTLIVLVAAVLLALVTVNTPVIKSIYFLSATIGGSGSQKGSVATFGTLGYCVGGTCSKPTLGYEFDPGQLLNLPGFVPGQYSGFVVKGLTYTLVLHPVGEYLLRTLSLDLEELTPNVHAHHQRV